MFSYGFLSLFLAISITAILQCYSLNCYTGTSFVRGQSVSKQTEVCKKESDQCYKASLEATAANKLKKAGCSTVLCMASRGKCTNQDLGGHRGEICCCSSDLCNAKQNATVGGMAKKAQGLLSTLGLGGKKN